jgi:glycine/D-amino acid oxidase-like deaminating enzyme
MVNIANLRLVAEKLIEANGRTISLVRKDEVTPIDPAKPWRANTTTTQVTISVIGAFIDFDHDDTEGTIIRRGEKRILIAAKSAEEADVNSLTDIENYDRVIDADNTVWSIRQVSVIQPGLEKVAYDMRVGR